MSNVLCVRTLIVDIINAKVERLPKEGECVLRSYWCGRAG